MICLAITSCCFPSSFFLNDWLKVHTPWHHLITFCGLGYVLVGAIGASILAVVWTSVLKDYATATPDLQLVLKNNFRFFNEMVYSGMWNLLEVFFAGFWWLAAGIVLCKKRYLLAGLLTVITGVSSLADGVAGVFQSAALHEAALNAYLLLAIIWALVMGAILLRRELA